MYYETATAVIVTCDLPVLAYIWTFFIVVKKFVGTTTQKIESVEITNAKYI